MVKVISNINYPKDSSCTSTLKWLIKWNSDYSKLRLKPKIALKRPKIGQNQ